MAGDPVANPASEQRKRRAMLDPERRARLLDPAEEEFAREGFEAASLNRILASAQMSKGQAYHYIADKADLYAAVMERALGRLGAAMDFSFGEPADADDFWSQLGELFTRVTAALGSDPQLAQLARGIHHGPGPAAALATPLGQLRRAGMELLREGQSVGAVRDDLPMSLLVDVVFAVGREIDHWFGEHWDELTPAEASRLTDQSLEMVRSLCEPRADEPTGATGSRQVLAEVVTEMERQ